MGWLVTSGGGLLAQESGVNGSAGHVVSPAKDLKELEGPGAQARRPLAAGAGGVTFRVRRQAAIEGRGSR